ncbi:MAG: MmgE/PrpD family protein [Burkholderiales bacterium]
MDRQTSVGPTTQLARHVSTLQYEQLPGELVQLTKQCILDTLGVAIAASTLAPEARIVADYVRELGAGK